MSEQDAFRPPVERNPVTRGRFRRQVWLQIYLPLVLGIGALAAASVFLWRGKLAGVSAWADASLMMLILPVLLIAMIPLLLAAGLIYGVSYVIGWLPGPALEAQRAMDRVSASARQVMQTAAEPMVRSSSWLAALRSGVGHLLSVFRKDSGRR